MARQVRIEYPGAQYHVINRGNYRKNLFTVYKTGEAFEKTLFEAAGRSGWIIHAYCIMSNHFHLCIETPKGNLVSGMQWLQSVFSNRFNKFVKGRGHVFQGRYKALLIDREDSLLDLVDYIHLNPVRAKIVSLEELKNYSLSSFPKFFMKKRPEMLVSESWLYDAGHWADSRSGMNEYWKYLVRKLNEEVESVKRLDSKFTRGWCLGSKEFKQEILKKLRNNEFKNIDGSKSMAELNEDSWDEQLEMLLNRLGKTSKDAFADKKGVDWKCAIGLEMKQTSSVTNRYLSENLHMGTIYTTSMNIEKYKKTDYEKSVLWKVIKKKA